MRVDGLNLLNLTKSLQIIDELNLKEGQTIIGRIISMAGEDALLDLAARPLQAKVEGNPPLTPGSSVGFKVATDPQGRIILRLINGSTENNDPNLQNNIAKTNPEPSMQKAIVAALKQSGLPVTPESTAKIFQLLGDFQAKYQQSVSPQVFTFILAQKWPVTPGTILLALAHQDSKLRDTLWNTLQKSMSQPEATELLSRFVLNPGANPALLAEKLQTAGTSKLQEFLGKLFSLSRLNNAESTAQPPASAPLKPTAAPTGDSRYSLQGDAKHGTASPALKQTTSSSLPERPTLPDFMEAARSQRGQITGRGMEKQDLTGQASLGKNAVSNPNPVLTRTEVRQAGTQPTRLAATAKHGLGASEAKPAGFPEQLSPMEPKKIGAVLDQNLALEKSLHHQEQPGCVIPFLVCDSNQRLRQCFIKWQEEKNSKTGAKTGEILSLSIPTEHLGEINLHLRIGGTGGIRVNLKVGSEEIRKFLMCHTEDLKKTLGQDSAIITVSMKENRVIDSEFTGLDVWM